VSPRRAGAGDLLIRDARPSDRDAIGEVTLAAYREYAARMPAHWERYQRNIVDTLADVGPAEQLVAEQGGAIAGAVLLYPTRTASPTGGEVLAAPAGPEVRLLAVAPAARGRGVGTALMQECVRRARRSGARVLTLHTTAMMQTALRIYLRMGFVRAPELDIRPAPDLTIEGYRLDLGSA
jgi:GNAT superfamily N-acetyltransferase